MTALEKLMSAPDFFREKEPKIEKII